MQQSMQQPLPAQSPLSQFRPDDVLAQYTGRPSQNTQEFAQGGAVRAVATPGQPSPTIGIRGLHEDYNPELISYLLSLYQNSMQGQAQ